MDFEISGNGEELLDLANTFIKVKVRVAMPDGNAGFPANVHVVLVNNCLQSMFVKVDVMLNRKTVCYSDYHYTQRADVETLLNFGADTKKRRADRSILV